MDFSGRIKRHPGQIRKPLFQMTDSLSATERSQNMAAIRNKNTKPELVVRKVLRRLKYRFTTHDSSLAGKPDVVLRARKKLIYVHGCFWHQHSAARCKTRPPKS